MHDNPQVLDAIKQIRQLDTALREKTLEQIMVAKETQPDKWVAKEQRRLEQRQRRVEKLLAKEREEHARRCALPAFLHGSGPLVSSQSDKAQRAA